MCNGKELVSYVFADVRLSECDLYCDICDL